MRPRNHSELASAYQTGPVARISLSAIFPLLLLTLMILVAGCGGDGVSAGRSSASFPPPFNTAAGEGNLLADQLIISYATTAPNAPSALALDSYYAGIVCPSGLTPAPCPTNTNSLNTPEFGNFDIVNGDPIGNNALGIKLVDAIKIDYTAINVDHTPVTVSGGIVIPEVAPTALKGLILYFHGTTVQRSNVPSNFVTTPGNSSGADTEGILLAAVWASQGYIVVMPDYIGLGDDTTHAHPYVVYPVQNAQSGLAMVRAARSLLASSRNIKGRMPLYITGYSEGGAYALEAEHLMQSNPRYASELKLRLSEAAPLSGFFDLSGTGLPYLFDNISPGNNPWFSLNPLVSAVSKPYLSAYLTLSFANYSGIAPTNIVATPFFNCPSGPTPCGSSGNLNGLYFTASQTANYDATVELITFGQASNTAWNVANNTVAPLLTPAYVTALTQRDMNNPLYHQLVNADTYLFVPKVPVMLVSLKEDSIVTRKNTDVAFSYFTAKNPSGPYKEVLVDNNEFITSGFSGAGPVDHTTELPFLSVLILNEFNMRN